MFHSPASQQTIGATADAAPEAAAVRAIILATPILVVEDEAMIAWLVEGLLEDMGFGDIRLAANSSQAHAMAERATPGLILSDINLGGGPDGIETAAAICRVVSVPVIFVTAYADDGTRARIGREVPGAPMLRKPFAAECLRQAIFAALEEKARNQARAAG